MGDLKSEIHNFSKKLESENKIVKDKFKFRIDNYIGSEKCFNSKYCQKGPTYPVTPGGKDENLEKSEAKDVDVPNMKEIKSIREKMEHINKEEVAKMKCEYLRELKQLADVIIKKMDLKFN